MVRWPYAAAARSLIHEADIAAVAVRALTEDGHAGKTYLLTGPQTLTQIEQVHAIGEAVARPLRLDEIAPDQARPGLVAAFADEASADSAFDTWATSSPDPSGSPRPCRRSPVPRHAPCATGPATTPRTSAEPRSGPIRRTALLGSAEHLSDEAFETLQGRPMEKSADHG